MSKWYCWVAVLSVLVGWTCTEATGAVRIGGIELPADCALARKEHPRLLFTKADLPRLRGRLKHPRIAAELEHVKRLAAENKAGAILLGVLYYLTEEPKYIEAAKVKLEPSWVQTYPLAADLVMGAMTPAEQQAEADRIVEIVKKERWRPHVVLDLAAWGHGHDDFLDADLKTRLRTDMIEGIEYNNLWSQGRGGSSMSHGYYGEHFYSEWFTMAVAWSNATGQDWVSKCDFAAHTLYEPQFDGEKTLDESLPPTEQLVVTPDGSGTAPNPKPGGRFLHLEATSFVVDDNWPDMTGRLFGKILFPELETRIVCTIGGPWHEFEVEGVNYGPTEETYTEDRSLGYRKEHDRENSIGLGGWRIELSPKGNPVATNFLVVFQAADQTTAGMVPVERIERENQIGAKVTVGTTAYEVTFATAGPTRGHIRVAQAGQVVLDRALANEVEDNYEKWSEDPRYEAWMTRPEYRNFIDGAYEQGKARDDD